MHKTTSLEVLINDSLGGLLRHGMGRILTQLTKRPHFFSLYKIVNHCTKSPETEI